jgi:chromosome segregation ATPase
MSTVWDKLRAKVKATVDEAGLELEKQRKIYAVRKEIGQQEATIREIKAELARLQDQRTAELAGAGQTAYELQKERQLGEKWEQVAEALEKVPEIEGRIEEEEGAIAALEQEIERFKEQIESIRDEYRQKRDVMREEEAAQAEEAEETQEESPKPEKPEEPEKPKEPEKPGKAPEEATGQVEEETA